MIKDIVLIGAGGFGRETASIIEWVNEEVAPTYNLLGFLDDDEQFHEGMMINGYPFLGKKEWILEHKDHCVCTCTIANGSVKRKIQEEFTAQGVEFETIIAGGGYIGKYVEIGKGCVFYGGVNIAVNCKIGDGVLLSQWVNVGHDTEIGDYSYAMPATGISGNCKIGSEVRIGGHAYLVPGVKVGDKATVAAGSIVFSNVKAGTTVLGNPAKRMKAIE